MLRYRAALAAAMLVFAAPAVAAPLDVTSSGPDFFVTADGWLVTNAHVLDGCTKASVPGFEAAVHFLANVSRLRVRLGQCSCQAECPLT